MWAHCWRKRDLATQDVEEADILQAFSASVFTSKTGLQESQIPKIEEKVWSKEGVSLLEEDQPREYLGKIEHA